MCRRMAVRRVVIASLVGAVYGLARPTGASTNLTPAPELAEGLLCFCSSGN